MAKPSRNDKKSASGSPKKAGKPRTPAEAEASSKPVPNRSARGGRETIDALVVAFVLAFMIRTFQAEQFVIPTGSMAPTLMGRHMDVDCAECSQRFKVNASDESAEKIQELKAAFKSNGQRLTPEEIQREYQARQVVAGTCPQCGYVMPFRSDNLADQIPEGSPPVKEQTNYGGDRIVVRKYVYSFTDPKRWDVVVFKYPGDSRANYIKRLVGLPNESLRIYQGDLFTRAANEEGAYAIERKPADKVLALRQLVHDTDHDPLSLYSAGWPLRWQTEDDAWQIETKPNGKKIEQTYRCESDDPSTGNTAKWLRYQHTIPNDGVWRELLKSKGKPDGQKVDLTAVAPQPSLVTDFVAYNSGLSRQQVASARELTNRPRFMKDFSNVGSHWAGDLCLDADVRIDSEGGELLFDLVEAGTHYEVAIDVTTGKATFSRKLFDSSVKEEITTAQTSLRGKGSHSVRFANVDDQLHLWIDNKLVEMDGTYQAAETQTERSALVPRTSEQDAGDLAPAGIGIAGGSVQVDRMQVWRDIYYLAARWDRRSDQENFVTDYNLPTLGITPQSKFGTLANIPVDPELWSNFADRKFADFEMDSDQFFVMGDNSAASLDARLWTGGSNPGSGKPGGPYLERHLLVGQALCVYWPHSWYPLPFTGKRIPIWPNFGDMRIVR